MIATAAFAQTATPTYTINNGISASDLPNDFTNVLTPAIRHLIVAQPFGAAIDVTSDKQWTMEDE